MTGQLDQEAAEVVEAPNEDYVGGVDRATDPFLSGYRSRRKGSRRRVRECYKGENKELWFDGWDAADADIKEENDQKITRFRSQQGRPVN